MVIDEAAAIPRPVISDGRSGHHMQPLLHSRKRDSTRDPSWRHQSVGLDADSAMQYEVCLVSQLLQSLASRRCLDLQPQNASHRPLRECLCEVLFAPDGNLRRHDVPHGPSHALTNAVSSHYRLLISFSCHCSWVTLVIRGRIGKDAEQTHPSASGRCARVWRHGGLGAYLALIIR